MVEEDSLPLPRDGCICIFALQSLIPLLPAKQKKIDEPEDWLPRACEVACPDPKGQVIFEIKLLQELFRSLVKKAAEEGVPFTCVVTDTWYFNKENMDWVEGLGKDWVAGCKSNRLILMPGGWMDSHLSLHGGGSQPKGEFKEDAIQTQKG
jgi:uncharacterized repeat protein (TIGR04076 family)